MTIRPYAEIAEQMTGSAQRLPDDVMVKDLARKCIRPTEADADFVLWMKTKATRTDLWVPWQRSLDELELDERRFIRRSLEMGLFIDLETLRHVRTLSEDELDRWVTKTGKWDDERDVLKGRVAILGAFGTTNNPVTKIHTLEKRPNPYL